MSLDDEDSVFEQALRNDLPSVSQQNRLRQRVLAAGVAAGTALGTTNVAAATHASFGASALSKLSALSWPAKVGLAAALAAPVATLPLVYAPVRGAALVSQVQTSAATVRARSLAKALPPAGLQPSITPQTAVSAHTADALQNTEAAHSAEAPAPPVAAPQANLTAHSSAVTLGNSLPAVVPASAATVNTSEGNPEPAVAAFDSVAHAMPSSEAPQARNESTLAAETQLLDRAFAALAAGDRNRASTLVAEHARLFPNGLLRQERERARKRLASDPQGE